MNGISMAAKKERRAIQKGNNNQIEHNLMFSNYMIPVICEWRMVASDTRK